MLNEEGVKVGFLEEDILDAEDWMLVQASPRSGWLLLLRCICTGNHFYTGLVSDTF